MDLLLENIEHEDLKKYLKEFYNYAKMELKLDKCPRLFLKRDEENAKDFFGKTGYYDPDSEEIVLFISNRHAKDILRSFSHELVHHAQKLAGFDDGLDLSKTANDPAYATNDPMLRNMERDAFERGNMIFRDWCDRKKIERKNIMSEKKMPKKLNKKADLNKDGKLSKYEKARGKAIEASIEKQAKKQAKEDMKSIKGKDRYKEDEDLKEQGLAGGPEGEALEPALEENVDHPYPQLLSEKDRLLGSAFNKREDLVYQELIRRFIKK
jgi:hypothetical protein